MIIKPLALLLLLGSNAAIEASNIKATKAFMILLKAHSTHALLTDGLLRLYRGNGDASDATGIGPTLTGEAQYTDILFPQSGRSRKVFDFANTLNGLMGSALGLPSGASDRSVGCWFKFGPFGGRTDGDPFGYGSLQNSKAFHIDVWPSNSQYSVTLDYWGGNEGINPILVTAETTWYHLVLMYSQTANIFTVYLNGNLLKTGTPHEIPNTDVNSAYPTSKFYIGQQASTKLDSNTRDWAAYRGQVADVIIYNRVLTSQEIQTIYANDDWYSYAGGGGDPHFRGFGNNLFTWQGICDVVLLTTTEKLNKEMIDFHIHVRTRRVRQWSAIDGISVKVGGNVAEIESNEGKLFHNGSQVQSIETSSFKVGKAVSKKRKLIYNFIFEGEKYLDVTANTRTHMIYISLSGIFASETKGILGSPSKPGFYDRDGIVMNGSVNSFIEHWQVSDKDPVLFRERRDPQFPEKCIYEMRRGSSSSLSKHRRLKEKDAISMKEAIKVCANHRSGPLRQFCVEDVIRTGDLDIVDEEVYG